MGNPYDGKNYQLHIKAVGEEQVNKLANEDTKLLIDVYNKLSKNGLTNQELETLESLDKVLDGVELKAPSSHAALFVERKGNTETNFSILGSDVKSRFTPKGR